jgi:hypothetical protein
MHGSQQVNRSVFLERHSSGFIAGDGKPGSRGAYECLRSRNDRPCAEVGPAARRDDVLERVRDVIDAPECLRLSAPFLAQRSRLSWMRHVVDRMVGRRRHAARRLRSEKQGLALNGFNKWS